MLYTRFNLFTISEKLKYKNVLIAPLDWGLGHATRCIPIINILLEHGAGITIAGNGGSLQLLKEQYPSLKFYELPGYNITYPSGKNAAVQSLFQAPKILRTIKEENKIIKAIVQKENINLIISDNRYGVRSNSIKNIFMGHQIAIQAPKPLSFINPLLLKLHLQQIHKFDILWIPDNAGEENLSGMLSHDISFDMPYQYIGIQSRFVDFKKTTSVIDELNFSILVMLSGPEPQRTDLELILRAQLKDIQEEVLIVQGKTEISTTNKEGNITTISYLNTNDAYTALTKAKKIICRSGYSSIMDLAILGKKAVLIPANGQTEQEYLAETLSKKGYCVSVLKKI